MKIYDTEKEAREAAGRLVSMLQVPTTEDDSGDSIIVTDSHSGRALSEFHYKPERVAPKKWQAVTDKGSGYVGYSLGTFSEGGLLRCCDDNEATTDSLLAVFTPVDIIPAGQFAKAVELLEEWNAIAERYGLGCRDTIKLLDEIKAGGE